MAENAGWHCGQSFAKDEEEGGSSEGMKEKRDNPHL